MMISSTPKSRYGTFSFALGSLLLVACGDPLKFAQDLEEARILGVKVATDGGRAWPKSGESAEIQLLIAGPDGPSQVSAAYSVCLAVASSSGVPRCAEDPFSEGSSAPSLEPSFNFTPSFDVDQEQPLAILGIACESGEPTLDYDAINWSCSDDSSPLRFTMETHGASTKNANPVLEETQVIYGEQEAELDATKNTATCGGAPLVSPERTVPVLIQLDSQSRSKDETLQLSHFSTNGRFERQFTIFEPDQELSLELDFTAPKELGPVKSYLVVRDDRGGTSWLSWSVCVSEDALEF